MKMEMKIKMKIFSLAWLLIPLAIAFMPRTPALTPSDGNGIDLIHKTCNHTAEYNLCVALLQSDPRSLTADVKGLASIMLDLTLRNTNQTLSQVKELLKDTSLDQRIKQCFLTCVEVYEKTTQLYIPAALNSLQTDSYADARKEGSDAFTTVQTCGRELVKSGGLDKEPAIIDRNKFDQHLASLSLDIIYILG
ncbi:cell wall / vacuolar inhibitor of fructosidase 2-like [Macadamia integrifolia]|uniref:cell wall / vacuolar inhibitor of fructosidase 2-like n=1 Tax=Macadamia integrifolia TaxID=60698 RepID=UPI001C4FBD02|nr:cell wall / vacuolar inhibitor of fructosidase 2-like [Macadamia integrifolia]